MANLDKIQNDFSEMINYIDELSNKYNSIKTILLFWGFKVRIKEINIAITELRKNIRDYDLNILPALEITGNRSDGEIRANKAITYFNSRNLVLSNLNKLEQDISNFENQQNFKKSLFLAVTAVFISLVPYIGAGIKYIISLI